LAKIRRGNHPQPLLEKEGRDPPPYEGGVRGGGSLKRRGDIPPPYKGGVRGGSSLPRRG